MSEYLHGRKKGGIYTKREIISLEEEEIVSSPLMEVKFKLLKSTPNTHRYEELGYRSLWKMRAIYLQKDAVEGKPPKKIVVTIEKVE